MILKTTISINIRKKMIISRKIYKEIVREICFIEEMGTIYLR